MSVWLYFCLFWLFVDDAVVVYIFCEVWVPG